MAASSPRHAARATLPLALLLLGGLGCGSHPRVCPPGYTPVCQSGAIHGTRCTCEPPTRYRDEH